MKPALQSSSFIEPYAWQDLPHGKWLCKQTERHLNTWLPRVFGYHLVKLGHLSAGLDCSASPIKHQISIAEQGYNVGVKADLHHLPLSENSVDAVLMAHNLNFTHDPHQLLREAHRVLIPDGYLFLVGFNPMSLCGIGRYLPSYKQKLPWSGRFFTPSRIIDWLDVLGCEVIAKEFYIQRSLLTDRTLIRSRALTRFSYQYLNRFGAMYLLVARKRELPLTPVKPKWKVKAKLQPIGSMRM